MPPEDPPRPQDPTPIVGAPTDIAPLTHSSSKAPHEWTAAEEAGSINWEAIRRGRRRPDRGRASVHHVEGASSSLLPRGSGARRNSGGGRRHGLATRPASRAPLHLLLCGPDGDSSGHRDDGSSRDGCGDGSHYSRAHRRTVRRNNMRARVSGIRIVSITAADYSARTHGFPANRRRGKCAHSNRRAASAVSFSPLRRELSRPDEYRVCDARDERRPGSERSGVWQGKRNFLYRLSRAANSRGVAGGTLERKAPAGNNPDHVGRTNNTHRFCAHSAGALRRAFPAWRGRGRVLSRRHFIFPTGSFIRTVPRRWRGLCPPFRLPIFLGGPLPAESGYSLARPSWMAMALLTGRRARDRTRNRDAVRAARPA